MTLITSVVYHSETKVDVDSFPIVFGDNCEQEILSNVITSQRTII